MKSKKKINLKFLLKISLFIVFLTVAILGFVKISSIKTKTVSPLNFSRGYLDPQTGDFWNSNESLCTKNAIECQGLSIVPNFDSKVTYQIFWYSYDDLYFGCTEVCDSNYKFSNEVPELARYARIVIYPSTVDENGAFLKDKSIKFYDVYNVAKSITVKVNIKQNFNLNDDIIKNSNLYKYYDIWGGITAHFANPSPFYHYYGNAVITNHENFSSIWSYNFAENEGLDNALFLIKVDDYFVFNMKLNTKGFKGEAIYKIFYYDSNKNLISTVDYTEYCNSVITLNTIIDGKLAKYILVSMPDICTDSITNIKLYGTLPANDVTKAIYSN